ncbi:hypothetical protein FYJ73_08515 [Prevotellaceae bacterium LKV-178-WT-2A]|uniref:Uncharacterized protein n=2 Tax=Hallella mizrahii TaxID=2606637 RepID=A0A7K0KFU0_9BACT|nr:hypothetical protein [Hallella mizrahii]
MGNTPHSVRYQLTAVLLVLFLGMQCKLLAQVPRDIPTIEAYINDHKKQRSLLLARSVLEESNQLLHQASEVTHREYRDINLELDKYTRAFDIIDLVYSTVSTGFNVYRTYDDVSDKLGKYKELLSEYNKKIIKRKRIESADTLLLTVNARAVRNLSAECRNLYSSVAVLAAYASGQVSCTPASMMLMVENINRSLDRIKDIVNAAYFQTWKFIQARTSYWKGELYRSKTLKEMAGEALGRWKGAGKLGY